VKESLFNIIAGELNRANVLDLFCGAGTLGLEALSRGAERVVFVDTRHAALACTRRNIELLDVAPLTRLLRRDALAVLNILGRQENPFSVIFADPPYGRNWPAKTLCAVRDSDCLAGSGILAIEHHKKDPPGEAPLDFSLWTSRRFGDTVITIWRWSRDRECGDRWRQQDNQGEIDEPEG
jgi:16S rRNA (guanine(966)-N(2))-methyltransferase RsmD